MSGKQHIRNPYKRRRGYGTDFTVVRCPLDMRYNPPQRAFRPTQSLLSRGNVSGSLKDGVMLPGTVLEDQEGVRWMAVRTSEYGMVLAEVEQIVGKPDEYLVKDPLHIYRPTGGSALNLTEYTIENYFDEG